MTIPITTGYASNAGRSVDEMKQFVEDLVALLKEQPGGIGKTAKTLSADSFALDNSASYFVLTGQAGAADDLLTITGGVNGRHVFIRSADGANIITVKHGTGANRVRCPKNVDVPLKDGAVAHLRFDSALGAGEWECLGVYYANQTADERASLGLGTAAVVNTGTGAGDVPTITQADARYAALLGSASNQFAVATPTTGTKAATKDYVDTAVASAGGGAVAWTFQLRLTTESGVPVSPADRTAQITLYLTPMYGGSIGLKIAGAWTMKQTAEISLALSGLTSGKNYDVWAYWTGAAVALELSAAWTNDTTRATALARDSGAWVKSGDATRLYVGTIRTTGTTHTQDSQLKRFVWNHFNRTPRMMQRAKIGAHSYSTATWRAWNNDAANSQIEYVLGLADQAISAAVSSNIGGTAAEARLGIGVDSTSANATIDALWVPSLSQTGKGMVSTTYVFAPAIGYHFIVPVEYATANQTYTDAYLSSALNG